MTGNDLIASALRLIGVLASGESPSAAEANDCLTILNQLLDLWNAERQLIFTIQMNEFPAVLGQQTYTLGTGGNFNMTRPARIERYSVVNLNNPAQPLELPLDILTHELWANIPVKIINSSLATKVYDDGAFPLRNINYWPIPTTNPVNFRFYSWVALNAFPDLVTDETFPPGYLKALRYNLAVDLAPEFGVGVPPEVAAVAASSKGALKSINTPLLDMKCDPSLVGTGGSKKVYNWLTDGPSTR